MIITSSRRPRNVRTNYIVETFAVQDGRAGPELSVQRTEVSNQRTDIKTYSLDAKKQDTHVLVQVCSLFLFCVLDIDLSSPPPLRSYQVPLFSPKRPFNTRTRCRINNRIQYRTRCPMEECLLVNRYG